MSPYAGFYLFASRVGMLVEESAALVIRKTAAEKTQRGVRLLFLEHDDRRVAVKTLRPRQLAGVGAKTRDP